jgi:hypothetical protein
VWDDGAACSAAYGFCTLYDHYTGPVKPADSVLNRCLSVQERNDGSVRRLHMRANAQSPNAQPLCMG